MATTSPPRAGRAVAVGLALTGSLLAGCGTGDSTADARAVGGGSSATPSPTRSPSTTPGPEGGPTTPAGPAPASASSAYAQHGAFAAGGVVAVGDASVRWSTISDDGDDDDENDNPFYLAQTSLGVVAADVGPGERVNVLIRADGATKVLELPPTEAAITGDPSSPHIAWLNVLGGRSTLYVADVGTGAVLAEIAVPAGQLPRAQGRLADSSIVLDGDVVYLGAYLGGPIRVDWRTEQISNVPYAVTSARGGIGVTRAGGRVAVRDLRTGAVLRRLTDEQQNARLSPDGTHLIVSDMTTAAVLAVGGGDPVPLQGVDGADGAGGVAEWTLDGHVLANGSHERTRILVCSVDGRCAGSPHPRATSDAEYPLLGDYRIPV